MRDKFAGTVTGQLHKDSDLLEFYFENRKWDLLDSKISEIITSNDLNRMKFILVIFKSLKKDKIFANVLEDITLKIEDKLGKKLY